MVVVFVAVVLMGAAPTHTHRCNPGHPCPGPTPTATPTPTPTPIPTPSPTPSPTPTTGYTFDDEFSGATRSSVWGQHWSGFGDSSFSLSNATVANGVLSLTARSGSSGWTGALVDTYGTFSQRYGHFQARAKIPKGYGLWPAFWLALPPAATQPPEIDAMEVCANPIGSRSGLDAGWLNTTVHFAGGGQADHGFRETDLSLAFHNYTIDWRAGHVTWYLDGVTLWTYTGSNTPSVAMPVIADLAVGGGWCGVPTITTPSPATMQVDYIRVTP